VLLSAWDLEIGEDRQKDEEIVDAEGVLDQITGHELEHAHVTASLLHGEASPPGGPRHGR
jgi:hypothetical protein